MKLETSEEKEERLAKNRDTYRKTKEIRIFRGSRDLKNSRSQEKNEKLWKLSKNRFKIAANERRNGTSYLK
jgi:hypothetical protein